MDGTIDGGLGDVEGNNEGEDEAVPVMDGFKDDDGDDDMEG